MTTFALDTNIISYVLRRNDSVIQRYRQELLNGNEFMMPPIVYFEIQRGLLELGAKSKLLAFEEMCLTIPLGELDIKVWNAASELYVRARKKGLPHNDADIIIAAFCVSNDYTLVTNNTRHFEYINELTLVNWM